MDRRELKFKIENFFIALGIWFAVSAVIFVFCYAFGWIISYIIIEINFFSRPENAHYTEYNTPHAIDKMLEVMAFQAPLTWIIALTPVLIFTICFIWYCLHEE